MSSHLAIISVGIIATAVIDVWALFVKHALKLPTTNWALVGRWFAYLPRGRLVHRPITETASVANELAIGWLAHYVIGIAYSYLYALILTFTGVALSLWSAIGFGVVTVVAAWFVLQPGLGHGVLARHAPKPWLVRSLNLATHFLFGCGLYLGWLLVGNV